MTQRVFGIVSTLEQADRFALRMREVGIKSDELIVANEASEIENVLHPQSGLMHSTKIGILLGAIVGTLIGIAQAIYIGPAELTTWARIATIVIWTSAGWVLYGAIVGGSGLFSHERIPEPVEHRFEEEVARERILVGVDSHTGADVDVVRTALADIGASNIYPQTARRA